MDAPGALPAHLGPRGRSGVAGPGRGSASTDHTARRGGTMTHSIDAPFPPPPTTTTSGATSGTGTASTTTTSSTTEVAKDEAKNLGQTAQQAGSQVASTAADQ